MVSHLIAREDDPEVCKESPHKCEKPAVSSQTVTIAIVATVLGLLVVSTLSIMVFFHLKKRSREKREDLEDQFQMSDYGLEDRPMPGRARKPPTQASQRLSFDDLPQPGKPQPNPFDDTQSERSRDNSNPPQWPKRVDSSESSQTELPKKQ